MQHSAPPTRLTRTDLYLLLAAVAAGAVFFLSLGRLWPLAELDLHAPREALEAEARAVLEEAGFEVSEHAAESALRVDAFALDYLQRAFGDEEAQRRIAAGFPVYRYDVLLKRRLDPDRYWVHLHPSESDDGRGLEVLAWGRTVQEDASGDRPGAEAARAVAREALAPWLGGASEQAAGWSEEGFYQQARPNRLDHYFVYERHLSQEPPLRERLVATVSGGRVTAVEHALVPPEAARRAARTRRAPTVALQMAGFLLAAVAVLGAFAVFLTRLRSGTARLSPAARWVAVIGVCALVTQVLRGHELLFAWDPLWPRWVAVFRSLAEGTAQAAWVLLVLFVVIAAGDALDREGGAHRGASLGRVARGRFSSAPVGLASLRGFLVGLVCGGVLAASVLAIEAAGGGWSPIQPQGFFFFALNSSAPALATLLYFLMVALVEELAYRFFAGTWLLSVTGRRWVAIVVPAILYGTTHTGLEFLPPSEPFWGRALALTLVGCVWGWAFLRFDALTVVLSHFTADLFIFNWPRLGSGDPVLVAKAVATIAVPLLPAVLWLLRRSRALRGPERAEAAR